MKFFRCSECLFACSCTAAREFLVVAYWSKLKLINIQYFDVCSFFWSDLITDDLDLVQSMNSK